ncbi:SWIM zinc finger family protein [Actinomadura alba]|uniref:SWIM zinc finger family protein n=1 Tax=Actinomadura alba TaxID=406431 RepID=UPI0028AB42E6|nr:SWIM zinc finger family protein [Actinomadura alba]
MSERWGRDQVLGLAPDAPSVKASGTLARPARWSGTGCDEDAVWGTCQGSGKSAYRASVDLSEPAFRCSCPSRKFPCKHALALLLLWSDGPVPEGAPPGWVTEWLTERRARAGRRVASDTAADGARPAGTRDPKTAERREQRVADGVAELDQWLRDQVAHGLAHAERAPYHLWDDVARRLVDAQAGALAGQVRRLASIPRRGADWPQRLLAEYALLRLLTTAFRRRAELPGPLAATVRARIGFTLTHEEVLAGERVRDLWYVAGSSDAEQDRLITRRVLLRGRDTGRSALVLSFAAPGRALDASLVVGDTVDAELAFYPGAQPLRAIVAARHAPPGRRAPRGTTVEELLREHAAALSRDPWLDRWPAVLAGLRLGRAGDDGWHVIDPAGHALPLRTTDPWRLLAVSGGRPLTVAGEWSARGLVPLSAWQEEDGLVIL